MVANCHLETANIFVVSHEEKEQSQCIFSLSYTAILIPSYQVSFTGFPQIYEIITKRRLLNKIIKLISVGFTGSIFNHSFYKDLQIEGIFDVLSRLAINQRGEESSHSRITVVYK